VTLPTDAEKKRLERPDLVRAGRKRLSWLERWNIRIIRSSFEKGLLDRILRFFQRTGARLRSRS